MGIIVVVGQGMVPDCMGPLHGMHGGWGTCRAEQCAAVLHGTPPIASRQGREVPSKVLGLHERDSVSEA